MAALTATVSLLKLKSYLGDNRVKRENIMKTESYSNVEVGPIRPPSEATSLMLRVTRNCSWNRCKFCHLYKGQEFSMRSVDEIISDIDAIKRNIDEILFANQQGQDALRLLDQDLRKRSVEQRNAFELSLQWLRNGMTSVFLQDGNSIVYKPSDLLAVLNHLTATFPQIERITTYARSKNLYRIKDETLSAFAQAGLNRIHIGMETGSDVVLENVNKGVTKEEQIIAGQKVKKSGIELSVYFMPGLGGEAFSDLNAIETADAFNQINPDFIRLRSLGVPKETELYQDLRSGEFTKLGDKAVVKELQLFLEHLEGIESTIMSDHILNLLQEVEGKLPADKSKMLGVVDRFLSLDKHDQTLYMVGRRTGIFSKLDDTYDIELAPHAQYQVNSHQVTPNNVEEFTAKMLEQFI